MVGLGPDSVKLDSFKQAFISMLGRDQDGCGLSYYGRMQQKGQFRPIGRKRGSGLINLKNQYCSMYETYF